jgi:hypothetical protein
METCRNITKVDIKLPKIETNSVLDLAHQLKRLDDENTCHNPVDNSDEKGAPSSFFCTACAEAKRLPKKVNYIDDIARGNEVKIKEDEDEINVLENIFTPYGVSVLRQEHYEIILYHWEWRHLTNAIGKSQLNPALTARLGYHIIQTMFFLFPPVHLMKYNSNPLCYIPTIPLMSEEDITLLPKQCQTNEQAFLLNCVINTTLYLRKSLITHSETYLKKYEQIRETLIQISGKNKAENMKPKPAFTKRKISKGHRENSFPINYNQENVANT